MVKAVPAAALAALFFFVQTALADQITLSSTTSTENSGLFGFILPKFTAATGTEVRVIAVGTGQAIRIARNGDADALLVHHRPSEEAFVADGFGVERRIVMYNDFVVLGPGDDPAAARGAESVVEAFRAIAGSGIPFASRGDDSGTHKAEKGIWSAAGLSPEARDNWYREMGAGMGATLNAAVAMGAYTLSDRATWLSFANKQSHEIVFQGDPALFNQYAVIAVNPVKHPHVNIRGAQAFVDWLTGPNGQAAIAEYRRDGEQLFFPNAE
ncbi:MAG: substrate-binding domain-containing protein [Minwuia sp.]|uniref:substrate-binding domain-containing protein n=1 Tax=Minwuia sp. TaxID=2493630 RepID=UPI003A895AB7